MKLSEVPIGTLVSKCATWNPKTHGSERFDYIDLSSIDKDKKEITGVERCLCSDAPSRARQLVKKNDVLVATVRPNLNGVAILGSEHDGMTASTGYCVLRPIPEQLDPHFLFHWVKTRVFVQRMVDVATGANYPAVSDAKVKASTIPLPPLDEQKRVAAILDAADALRAKRRESIAQLDALLQSTFLEMFGDPIENPKCLPTIKLSDLGRWQSGGTPARNHPEYFLGELPWFSSGELNALHTQKSKEKISYQAVKYTSAKLVGKGSLLVGMYDTAAFKSSIAAEDCSCNQAVAFSKLENNIADTIFIYSAIQVGKERYRNLQRGIRQKNLNLSILKNIETILPDLKQQSEFANIVKSVEQQKFRMRTHLAELDALFASLQHRAFNGEL